MISQFKDHFPNITLEMSGKNSKLAAVDCNCLLHCCETTEISYYVSHTERLTAVYFFVATGTSLHIFLFTLEACWIRISKETEEDGAQASFVDRLKEFQKTAEFLVPHSLLPDR